MVSFVSQQPQEGTACRAPTKSTALRRRWIAGRAGFACRGSEQARTGTENLTVGPVLFAKKNLAVARIAVVPARDKGKMLAEFVARCGRRWYGGLFSVLHSAAVEIALEDVFRGARLAGNFSEEQEKWLGEPSAMDREDADGLLFGGALENHGVEIFDAPGQLGAEAQRVVEFFDAFVELRGTLEIELGAGALAVGFDGKAERVAVGVEKLHKPLNFAVVFLFGASRKARREAHFHFGIDAAGKRWIAADFDLAAADFEEVESLRGKGERGFSRRERAVVSACCGRASFVNGDAARDVASRVGVAQADFQDGGRAQARKFAIAVRKKMLGVLIVGED